MNSSIKIFPLSPSHSKFLFDAVAELHISEIHHGILPLLGKKFLSRIYYELSRAPYATVLCAVQENHVIGFLAGSGGIRISYRAVFLGGHFRFALLALPAFFSAKFLRKLGSLFRYALFQPKRATGEAELLAIAVQRNLQKQGVGEELVQEFEKNISAWGNYNSYSVATDIHSHVSNNFYKKLGFVACETKRHHRLTLQIYRKPFLQTS